MTQAGLLCWCIPLIVVPCSQRQADVYVLVGIWAYRVLVKNNNKVIVSLYSFNNIVLGVVAQAMNPSTREAEAVSSVPVGSAK